MKASQLHSYHVDITDYQVNDPHSNELWDICYEIRKTIFCYELQYLENEEFDEIDQRSRHVVGFGKILLFFFFFLFNFI